ncbi:MULTISPECIES: DUF6631 family protein [Halomonas]|uniref:Uncharacterized protein n=1 Tax=Halomonas halophila TaxID=29573 RepID=A0ABQ0U3N9_9GAMM|nr:MULTISPECIES: DUF6631 family protein [Halomonas]MDR5889632.1 hypothetical protein [Halomonas salina]WJY06314.1 hypothetical protein QWG60_11410 [Halomonas halophila]GEK71599.1 hypothetical protein HHA04nite_01430 [Halomonas halophila]
MSEQQAEQDPEILFPDETLCICGEEIRVHEFRFAEGLRAIALARPILSALREIPEGEDDPELVDHVLADHLDAWLALIAMSTDKDVAWVRSLPDADGQSLSMVFWRVNGAFFMRRLVLAGGLADSIRGVANLCPSRKSSPSSSPPDTAEAPTTSADS